MKSNLLKWSGIEKKAGQGIKELKKHLNSESYYFSGL
jgi:hypothetical protein